MIRRVQERRGISVDFSLGLINRTGAYYISRDLVDGSRALISSVYYWRLPLRSTPSGLLRKILARVMLGEYRLLRDQPILSIRRNVAKVLYLDPLYVLRSELRADDIVLCHDVGPLTHSAFFEPETVSLYQSAYQKIRRAGAGVVFVSEASRRAFVELFGSNFRFQRVIALYPRREMQVTAPRAIKGLRPPFILAVGGLEHRKNYVRCLDAFSQSVARKSHSYVICGPRGNAADAVYAAAKAYSNVRVLGSVRDDELSWLYRNADAFLLPSLLEGFGVPVIEAAERGLLCVTSAGGAQEEALGGHGIFVNPTETASIVDGIDRLVGMNAQAKSECTARALGHTATLTREAFLDAWTELLRQELAATHSPDSSSYSLEARTS